MIDPDAALFRVVREIVEPKRGEQALERVRLRIRHARIETIAYTQQCDDFEGSQGIGEFAQTSNAALDRVFTDGHTTPATLDHHIARDAAS